MKYNLAKEILGSLWMKLTSIIIRLIRENIAEHQLISSISYFNRESTQIERGISMDELKRLWDKYSVNEERRLNMTRALASLKDKKILYSFTDEGREVYRLSVDLFRRWWFVHHKDLDLEFSL